MSILTTFRALHTKRHTSNNNVTTTEYQLVFKFTTYSVTWILIKTVKKSKCIAQIRKYVEYTCIMEWYNVVWLVGIVVSEELVVCLIYLDVPAWFVKYQNTRHCISGSYFRDKTKSHNKIRATKTNVTAYTSIAFHQRVCEFGTVAVFSYVI
jgi:hypothetical protein